MSTNKSKAPSVTKNMEKLNHEICKKIAQKVADDHKGQPKPQLLHKVVKKNNEEIINKFLEGLKGKNEVISKKFVVCWMQNEHSWERVVLTATFAVDFTGFDHTPTEKDLEVQLIKQIKDWENRGWRFTEEDAYNDLIIDIERVLGHAHIDQQYHPMCPLRGFDFITKIYNTMRNARIWIESTVPTLREKVDEVCEVIPDTEKYEIKNRKWVEKTVRPCKCGGKHNCKKGK